MEWREPFDFPTEICGFPLKMVSTLSSLPGAWIYVPARASFFDAQRTQEKDWGNMKKNRNKKPVEGRYSLSIPVNLIHELL